MQLFAVGQRERLITAVLAICHLCLFSDAHYQAIMSTSACQCTFNCSLNAILLGIECMFERRLIWFCKTAKIWGFGRWLASFMYSAFRLVSISDGIWVFSGAAMSSARKMHIKWYEDACQVVHRSDA